MTQKKGSSLSLRWREIFTTNWACKDVGQLQSNISIKAYKYHSPYLVEVYQTIINDIRAIWQVYIWLTDEYGWWLIGGVSFINMIQPNQHWLQSMDM